jgi:hypothetical protein
MSIGVIGLRAPRLVAAILVASSIATASRVAVEHPPAAKAAGPVLVTAWAPYWEATDALTSFNAQSDQFSELTPFFFSATAADQIVFNPNMGSPTTNLQKYRDAATAKGKPLVATIVDAMPAHGMAGVLSTPEGRTAHVQALIAFAVNGPDGKGGFTGLDLDYEQFAFSDGRLLGCLH